MSKLRESLSIAAIFPEEDHDTTFEDRIGTPSSRTNSPPPSLPPHQQRRSRLGGDAIFVAEENEEESKDQDFLADLELSKTQTDEENVSLIFHSNTFEASEKLAAAKNTNNNSKGGKKSKPSKNSQTHSNLQLPSLGSLSMINEDSDNEERGKNIWHHFSYQETL